MAPYGAGGDGCAGPLHAEEELGDWACLTEADLEADLAEIEEDLGSAAPKAAGHGVAASEDKLRAALKRNAAKTGRETVLDADALFAAPRALQGIATELQEVLVDLETLQFDAAALTASVTHGPRQPPQDQGAAGAWTGHPAPEVFGLSAPRPRPPALDLNLPARSGSFEEYQRRLEALPRALYLDRSVALCVGAVDKYQDGKDISRDDLVVNGQAVSGSQGGYDAAVRALADGLSKGEEGSRSSFTPEEAARGAQLLLSVLNRTSSGFAAFEEVLRLFDCPDVVIVSPDSAAARPLEAAVLGGCALGRAHTRYAVRDASGDGAPLAVVDTEFSFKVKTSELADLVREPDYGYEREDWPVQTIVAAVLMRWS